ncbi:hypothetical protein SDC9_175451 [bioreactor metagenome]|uniref:Uncharacterized protein n=1 Tax=bioreactor metagenome TaxID=1076179 RepID=A0A645GMA8_9ZZZZ
MPVYSAEEYLAVVDIDPFVFDLYIPESEFGSQYFAYFPFFVFQTYDNAIQIRFLGRPQLRIFYLGFQGGFLFDTPF